MNSEAKRILVIGGGISGITAAVEAAEVGYEVILVEKEAYLGGRVVRMHQYFPKMCPPSCGLEINFRRIRSNPRITIYTLAQVESVSGVPGLYEVSIKCNPRYVTGKVPLTDAHEDLVSSERPNDFNYGMDNRKALYLPHQMSYPMVYVLDRGALSYEDKERLEGTCPAGSIDFDMQAERIKVTVGSIVIATGWQPYDAAKIDNLGFGRYANVVTNVMMERLAAENGPTGGKILRPSDNAGPQNVAFIQCAGSRDENYLPYCSAVCCMGSLKQTRYLREQYPETSITVFYIDIRTLGRLEKFYYDMLGDEYVTFVKGKVAKIEEDTATKNLQLVVEDTLSGEKLHATFDLVVLATGIVPNTAVAKLPIADLKYDQYGFILEEPDSQGILAAGCAKRPVDVSRSVRDATAAALKAIQSL